MDKSAHHSPKCLISVKINKVDVYLIAGILCISNIVRHKFVCITADLGKHDVSSLPQSFSEYRLLHDLRFLMYCIRTPSFVKFRKLSFGFIVIN